MKITINYSVAICMLLLCCLACNNNKPTTQNLDKTTNSEIESTTLSRDYEKYEIGKDTAAIELKLYKEYIDSVHGDLLKGYPTKYKNNAAKLIYGAKIDRGELIELLADSEQGDSLYILTALKLADPDATSLKTESHMIFALRETIPNSDMFTWRYYNFTQACPTSCPDLTIYNSSIETQQ